MDFNERSSSFIFCGLMVTLVSVCVGQDVTFSDQLIIAGQAHGVYSAHSADLDGDGDLDILSASKFDDKIAWYENLDGTGNFGSQKIISETADNARSVFSADFDGDGDEDVVSASVDEVTWYENVDGVGHFGPSQVITTLAQGGHSVMCADIDGDGDFDVLLASGGSGDNFQSKVTWYENSDGAGTFGPQQVITTEIDDVTSVYCSDLDGDGDLDVLSTSHWDDKVAWYENEDGAGSFGMQRVVSTLAHGPASVFSADLDGDGDKDILSASMLDDKIAWYENVGEGQFGDQQVLSTSLNLASMVFCADLDGDDDLDILAAGISGMGWLENIDGAGNFGELQEIENEDLGLGCVSSADLDGDGSMDILSTAWFLGKVFWHKNEDGLGSFGPQRLLTVSAVDTRSVFASDLDCDGDLDILSTTWEDITWFENVDGAGHYGPPRVVSAMAPEIQSLCSADLDGDGDMDVIAGGWSVTWYENVDCAGEFGPGQVFQGITGMIRSISCVDLDGDDDLDVLIADESRDETAWYENEDGAGSFGPKQEISSSTWSAHAVYSADIDGDGDLDVISASAGDNKVAWYENIDGGGHFGDQQIISIAVDYALSLFCCDLDGDGDVDVLAGSLSEGIVWFENTDGLGGFGPSQSISISEQYIASLFCIDLDMDGDMDLVSASWSVIGWFENMDGAGLFGAQQVISSEVEIAESVFCADIDGDGDLDILSASSGDQKVAWYRNTTLYCHTPQLQINIYGNGVRLTWDDASNCDYWKIYRMTSPHDLPEENALLAVVSENAYFDDRVLHLGARWYCVVGVNE